MDWDIRFTDIAIICATILGPILAVQAQKFLERRREIRERQEWIFRTLMTTRANALAPQHIEALNSIPITFYGKGPRLEAINNAWKTYLDHLNTLATNQDWGHKRLDLLMEIMHKISVYLGYSFTSLELRRDIYSPQAYGKAEEDALLIRTHLVEILSGARALPLDVKSFPFQAPSEPAEKAPKRKTSLKSQQVKRIKMKREVPQTLLPRTIKK